MTPEHWHKIHTLFDAAIPLEPVRREAYLDEACAVDPALRSEVAELLRQHEMASRDHFLDGPPLPSIGGSYEAMAKFPEIAASAVRYQPVRLHARGGLGEVYLAHDEQLDREVALKRMHDGYSGDGDSRRRFLVEAEVTAKLEHPGVVPVHCLAEAADGLPCYIMRFIQGDTLEEAIQRFHEADRPGRDPGERSLAFRQLLNRFIMVCNTVAYAHSRGVVHCDIKPSNVLLGKYGETFLVDWGLAKRVARDETARATGELTLVVREDGEAASRSGFPMGTPAYMSPEQARGDWDEVGPASDVYSLGATLYVLLTGKAPFVSSLDDVLERVQCGEFPPPRQVKKEVSRALEAVCQRAMALEVEQRYATAQELATELEGWLADEPVTAYREPWYRRLRRWGSRSFA